MGSAGAAPSTSKSVSEVGCEHCCSSSLQVLGGSEGLAESRMSVSDYQEILKYSELHETIGTGKRDLCTKTACLTV